MDSHLPVLAGRGAARRGFTLVELLVVLGIILLLLGMLFVGMNYVGRSARENASRTALNAGRALIGEYESTAAISRLEAAFWQEEDLDPGKPVPAPGNVSVGSADRNGDVVHATHKTMTLLMHVPANRAMLEQIPPDRLMPDADDDDHAPVLLDGWKNPVIFVPREGLSITGAPANPGEEIITSLGRRPYNPAIWPLPNSRPFFVSAGPSESFRASGIERDDNIYSFEE